MSGAQLFLPYRIAAKPTNVGAPGAQMFVYSAGTTTKRPVYASSSLTTQLSNPVIADGAGRFSDIWLNNSLAYKLVIKDKNGATLDTFDNYVPGQAPDATALQPYSDAAAASATAASDSADNASTAATAASTSASAAASSATAAASSQSAAAASASSASASATTATTQASISATAAANASSSYNAIAAAIAGYPSGGLPPVPVATVALLKAIASPAGSFYVYENGKAGTFVTDTWANLSADAANQSGIEGYYVQSTADPTKGFKRLSPVLWPSHFGVVGDGSTNDLAALQAFNDFVFATPRKEFADWTGDFGISGKLYIGPSSSPGLTTKYNVGGNPRFTQLTATFESIRYRNMLSQTWCGKISVTGTGSTSFASRTSGVGVCLENSGAGTITGGFSTRSFWYDGVTTDPTVGGTDGLSIPFLRAYDCGSGSPGYSLTANWLAYSAAVSVNGTSQRGQITVDALPPVGIDTYRSVGTQPIGVRINGYVYYVYSFDRVANTVTFFPLLDPTSVTAGSGTLEWVFGAGAMFIGSDNGVNHLGYMHLIRCGQAFVDASLYGQRVASMVVQSSGSGVVLGSAPGDAHVGTSIDAYYVESTSEQIRLVARPNINANAFSYINSSHELDLTKVFGMPTNRDISSGVLVGEELGHVNTGPALVLAYRGNQLIFEGAGLNTVETTQFRGHQRPHRTRVVPKNSETVTIQKVGSGEYNRLFGYKGGRRCYVGTGTNGAPTGTIAFTPPSGGTINGGAADAIVSFSDFNGPAEFEIYHTDTAQLTWIVRCLAGKMGAGWTGVDQLTNGNKTLNLTSHAITQYLDVPITGNRTVVAPTPGKVGRRFRFVRSANATGAFNLNINTSSSVLIKALSAAGSFAEIEDDGTEYRLVSAGTL